MKIRRSEVEVKGSELRIKAISMRVSREEENVKREEKLPNAADYKGCLKQKRAILGNVSLFLCSKRECELLEKK